MQELMDRAVERVYNRLERDFNNQLNEATAKLIKYMDGFRSDKVVLPKSIFTDEEIADIKAYLRVEAQQTVAHRLVTILSDEAPEC